MDRTMIGSAAPRANGHGVRSKHFGMKDWDQDTASTSPTSHVLRRAYGVLVDAGADADRIDVHLVSCHSNQLNTDTSSQHSIHAAKSLCRTSSRMLGVSMKCDRRGCLQPRRYPAPGLTRVPST
jgi:hypothetical protein